MRTACLILIVIFGGTGLGCQSWHNSSALPSLQTSRAQQKILDNLENDPFPSPAEVGMRGSASK